MANKSNNKIIFWFVVVHNAESVCRTSPHLHSHSFLRSLVPVASQMPSKGFFRAPFSRSSCVARTLGWLRNSYLAIPCCRKCATSNTDVTYICLKADVLQARILYIGEFLESSCRKWSPLYFGTNATINWHEKEMTVDRALHHIRMGPNTI